MTVDAPIPAVAASDAEVFDPRFARLVIGHVRLERLWTGGRWAEGPVDVPAAGSLPWSDIPDDRVMRYDETGGSVSVFEARCGFHNGHTLDREGRVVACLHGGRCIGRRDRDGNVWTSRGRGVDVHAPGGTLVGGIPVSELVSNLAFGDRKRNRLHITAQTPLYAFFVDQHPAGW